MAFNSNSGKQNFSATAAQTGFDFNFKIYDDTDVKVYLTPVGQEPDDAADLLTLASEYTVSVNGDLGGTVTLLSGATLNDVIVVKRELPVTRTISYVTQGDLLATTINIDQNYQTYLIIDATVELAATLRLPDTAVGVTTQLPAVIADAYLKWNAAGDAIENDTTIPDAVISAADSVLDANSWANEAEDTPVEVYTAGVGANRSPTVYSALHYSAKSSGFSDAAELEKWEAEAEALTSLSYAIQVEDTFVDIVTSDGDGTFTLTPTTDYSSLHWAAKAAAFNPALYALLTGATFTGQVKGITPVAIADLTRKDYVDTNMINATSDVVTNGQDWTDGVDIGGGETLYPDGSVYGVNANGEYIKHPNGDLECRCTITLVYVSAVYLSVTQTFPHAFKSGEIPSPAHVLIDYRQGGGTRVIDETNAETHSIVFRTLSNTSANTRMSSSTSFIGADTYIGEFSFFGRWK